jgi:hypothetical protein
MRDSHNFGRATVKPSCFDYAWVFTGRVEKIEEGTTIVSVEVSSESSLPQFVPPIEFE